MIRSFGSSDRMVLATPRACNGNGTPVCYRCPVTLYSCVSCAPDPCGVSKSILPP